MEIEIKPLKHRTRWEEVRKDVNGYQVEFAKLLLESPQFSGRVLDIGCGGDFPAALGPLRGRWGSLHGVDPSPGVLTHPWLQERWQGTLEESAVPAESYDMAFAFNVLEHIVSPRPFLMKVAEVLKPGGVFYGLTPNSSHLFSKVARLAEICRLKPTLRQCKGANEQGQWQVNDYPSYYRCNSPHAIAAAIQGLPFRKASFFYYPHLGMSYYFPKPLLWFPLIYDYMIGARFSRFFLLLIVKLEKAV